MLWVEDSDSSRTINLPPDNPSPFISSHSDADVPVGNSGKGRLNDTGREIGHENPLCAGDRVCTTIDARHRLLSDKS